MQWINVHNVFKKTKKNQSSSMIHSCEKPCWQPLCSDHGFKMWLTAYLGFLLLCVNKISVSSVICYCDCPTLYNFQSDEPIFYLWLRKVLANEEWCYICNIFSHWIWPCLAVDRKWAQAYLSIIVKSSGPNTMRPNSSHLADNILKWISMKENVGIFIWIHWRMFLGVMSPLVHVMAWHQASDKPLPEPVMTMIYDSTWCH